MGWWCIFSLVEQAIVSVLSWLTEVHKIASESFYKWQDQNNEQSLDIDPKTFDGGEWWQDIFLEERGVGWEAYELDVRVWNNFRIWLPISHEISSINVPDIKKFMIFQSQLFEKWINEGNIVIENCPNIS